MAKKAELETDYNRCGDLSRRGAAAGKSGDHRIALELAVQALAHLSGALGYQRRFLKPDRIALPPAELILRLAPPLFARRALDALAGWAAGLSRAERAAVPDLPGRVAVAWELHAAAVRGWAALDGKAVARPAPTAVLQLWLAAGLVERTPAGDFRRVTDPRRAVVGKCPGCGQGFVAPLRELLDPVACPGCGRRQAFAIIRRMEGS